MMNLTPRQRWMILGSALAVTVVLVFWPQKEPEEPAPARAPMPPQAQAPTPMPASPPAGGPAALPPPSAAADLPSSLRIARSDLQPGAAPARDLFERQSWTPPPSPAATAPAGPPPLPFVYFGKLIEDGQVTVYLADQERNLAVRKGDVIDGTYRVQSVTPSSVTFVYIPMKKQQTLDIGRKE